MDLPCPQARDLDSDEPFKGNIDLHRLEEALRGPDASRVALVIRALTNNGEAGQPVSMDNLARAASLCREHSVPLFLDAARFAENAWLVTQHEAGYREMSPRQVAEQAFRLADGCLMSAKKDGIVHIGGVLGLRDRSLAERCELLLIATEGFPTYGGLAGRDLEMIARGLTEVTEPCCLRARADAARHLARLARDAGVAIVEPPGLHALYLNTGRLLPHIAAHRFPGHARSPASSTWKAASARSNWVPSTSAARTRKAPRSPQRHTSWSGSRFPAGRTSGSRDTAWSNSPRCSATSAASWNPFRRECGNSPSAAAVCAVSHLPKFA